MAIAPTGTIYKSLDFDGESSRDYGIYITGAAVYNAPERDVEMISIPGRNGAFALDKGRFENIEVSYPAGIFADTETDFAEAISDFRNYLCSRKGYVRLTDEYNPNEFRMAVYKSGLEVSPAQLKAGEFNIVFDCMPQRYLLSGEEPITIGEWSNARTASGTIASFEAVEGDGVKSLVADIEPYQSGSGTPSPDNVRPISGYDSVEVWGDPKYGGTVAFNQQIENGNFASSTGWTANRGSISVANNTAIITPLSENTEVGLTGGMGNRKIPKGHKALLSIDVLCIAQIQLNLSIAGAGAWATSNPTISANTWQKASVLWTSTSGDFGSFYAISKTTLTTSDTITFRNAQVFDLTQMFGSTVADYIYALETATAGAGVAWFKNLFPKDYYAYNAGTSTCVSAVNGDPYNHYTTSLSGTRYGGTLDVVSGILTVDTLKLTFNGTEDWRAYNGFYYVATGESGGNPQEMLCNAFDWKGIQTPATPQIGDFWAGYTSGGVWTGNICFKYDDGSNLNAFKTYIASIPLEVTYKIEPVTYEVSQPMSYIQLATGTNNFWADIGDITVEYGTIPYKVYNPTLFEARPMLEVEGHGNININGETITLNDAEVGNTAIADASVQNWPTSTSYTYTFDIDVSMLNEGDIITVPRVALEYSYAINDGYTNVRSSVDLPRDATGATNASGTTQKITLNAGSFAYKTAGSYDGSVWFDVSWNSPNADSDELQRMARVSYDGEHTITLVSVGSNADEECYTRTGTKWIIPTIYGNSTKMISSIVDKAYIDLDVGEAYFVDDGTVVSLNNVATLPAELPTLKAGANEITFDNTVTDLKLLPRWWKV